jgi:hypothetical protein
VQAPRRRDQNCGGNDQQDPGPEGGERHEDDEKADRVLHAEEREEVSRERMAGEERAEDKGRQTCSRDAAHDGSNATHER